MTKMVPLLYLSVERLRWEPRTKEGRTFKVKRMIWGFFLVLGDTEISLSSQFYLRFPSLPPVTYAAEAERILVLRDPDPRMMIFYSSRDILAH